MQSLADGHDFLRIAWYGDPGSGKTTAIAGGARLGRIRVANVEEGLYAGPLKKLGVPVERIIPHADCTFAGLMDLAAETREQLADDADAWAALTLDTCTELAEQWIAASVDERVARARKEAAARGEAYTKMPYGAEFDDYRIVNQQFRRVLRAWADLPCHIGYTAHVRRDVDEIDQEVSYGPAVTPAVQAALLGHVSILVWTRVAGEYDDGRPIHVGQTRGTGKYKSKDRLNALPRTLVNPSLDRIVGYVEGELDEATDPLQLEFEEWKAALAAQTQHDNNDN